MCGSQDTARFALFNPFLWDLHRQKALFGQPYALFGPQRRLNLTSIFIYRPYSSIGAGERHDVQGDMHQVQGAKAGRNGQVCLWAEALPDMRDIHKVGGPLVPVLRVPPAHKASQPKVQGKAQGARRGRLEGRRVGIEKVGGSHWPAVPAAPTGAAIRPRQPRRRRVPRRRPGSRTLRGRSAPAAERTMWLPSALPTATLSRSRRGRLPQLPESAQWPCR